MAYDQKLVDRIAAVLDDVPGVVQKKMFGGIAFMVKGHMCVGVINKDLMARVGPNQYEDALARKHAHEMTFTGKPMRGMVFVDPAGLSGVAELKIWVDRSLAFVGSLPPKKKI